MTAAKLHQKFLEFFAARGHAIIPSASLLPENDPTVLFTTAGMHPLVPFLLGEKHPAGTRLASCQKCVRTDDIDEVGDATHLTFFEMLGNWSFGAYWKKEAIEMSFEFLTSELNFPFEKLAVSVFAGDEAAPFDAESFEAWKNLGIAEDRIAKLPKSENWWGPAGQTGPCGPDTEMFYWSSDEPAPEKFDPENENWVEIWNDVFMEFNETVDGKFEPLTQKNVDTGLGFERVLTILQKKKTIFETDLFVPIIAKIRELANTENEKSERIIADHLRAATFIIGDPCGVEPSNTDAGYIVRRLIRRAIREARKLGFDLTQTFTPTIAEEVIKNFGETYPELVQNSAKILLALEKEENQFKKTLQKGEKELQKLIQIGKRKEEETKYAKNLTNQDWEKKSEYTINIIAPKDAFDLYQTYGFPLELINEELAEYGFSIDEKEFNSELKKHQELSRTASEGKFSGGLADNSAATAHLHTATHLLNAALRKILGEHVQQKGSNITAERLRFDFSHSEKLTPEQKIEVEKLVNEQIEKDLPVECCEMSVAEAKDSGAVGVFDEKYGTKVKVYSIGAFSKEICGGPHASKTGELGHFKIKKESSSSAGVRRIKAVLEK